MTHIKYFLTPLLLFLFLGSNAQDKYEKEDRVDAAEVPEQARVFIAACPFKAKLRWYREESDQGTSYECKTSHENDKYSIEFDSTGRIQDVEIEISKGVVSKMDHLVDVLNKEYGSYKISKVQEQYTGDRHQLLQAIKDRTDYDRKNYEIVLSHETEGLDPLYEVLISDDGKLLSKKRIIERGTLNLDF